MKRILTILASFVAVSSFAGLATLPDYLDIMSSTIPNKLSLSVYEEVGYTNNLHSRPHQNATKAFFSKTGVAADIFRSVSRFRYGLQANASYSLYTKDEHDFNKFNWSIVPHIDGSILELENRSFSLSVNASSQGRYNRMGSGDNRYARHYTTTLGAVLDYARTPRWGALTSFDYRWEYYPSNKYNSYTKHVYEFGFSPYYKVTEKTKVGVHASYQWTTYNNNDTNDDNHRYRVNGYVDWRPSAVFSFNVEAGAEYNAYEGASRDAHATREWRPNALFRAKYVPSNQIGIVWTTMYSSEDSTVSRSMSEVLKNTFCVNWEPSSRLRMSVTLGHRQEDERNSNQDATEYFLVLGSDYSLTEHLGLYASWDHNIINYKYETFKNYWEDTVKAGIKWTL